MISCMSEDINNVLKKLKIRIEKTKNKTVATWSIVVAYIFLGSIMLIIGPSWIFGFMEGSYWVLYRFVISHDICLDWTFLDCIYFAFISLSTIGFGDFVPRNSPPVSFGNDYLFHTDEVTYFIATHVLNVSECLAELINPMPTTEVDKLTGVSQLCSKVTG